MKIDWYIINYQAEPKKFSKEQKAYHLFDLGWLRYQIVSVSEDERGKKETLQTIIGKDRYFGSPDATIVGYGDFRINSVPQIKLGRGEYPKGNERIEKKIMKDRYTIVVYKHPVWMCYYINLDDEKLINKRLEILGQLTLGSAPIETETGSFYYPLDKYKGTFLYRSSDSSRVTFEFVDIEDLDITGPRKSQLITEEKTIYPLPFVLKRKNIWEKVFWPLATILFSLFGPTYTRNKDSRRSRRRWSPRASGNLWR